MGVVSILVRLSRNKGSDISVVTNMLSMIYEDVKAPQKGNIKNRVRDSRKC